MPTFWKLQSHMRADGGLEWEGAVAALEHSLIGWRGLPEPFSAKAKREFLSEFSTRHYVWLKELVTHIYSVALLGEDKRKNS